MVPACQAMGNGSENQEGEIYLRLKKQTSWLSFLIRKQMLKNL